MRTTENILQLENITAGYGHGRVLDNLALKIEVSSITAVLGEEGAGKSTLLKVITRQITSGGHILLNGIDITSRRPHEMISCGIDYMNSGGNILNSLTVEEHIELAYRKMKRPADFWEELEKIFPRIEALKHQPAGTLSGGERVLLSIACCMLSDAPLVILDEPSAGLSPEMCEMLYGLLTIMKAEKRKTILLLENNYDFAIALCDAVTILANGKLSKCYTKEESRQQGFLSRHFNGI